MKDAYERRSLLLHLGKVLEAVNRLPIDRVDERPVHEIVAEDASLAQFPLLAQLSPGMRTREFVRRAASAFFSWPAALLEAELDREQLALSVQRALFADNPAGWHAYVAVLQQEVAWFGLGVPAVEAIGGAESVPDDDAERPDSPDSDTVPERTDAGDIERNDAGAARASRESVESGSPLYPSWPWKSSV